MCPLRLRHLHPNHHPSHRRRLLQDRRSCLHSRLLVHPRHRRNENQILCRRKRHLRRRLSLACRPRPPQFHPLRLVLAFHHSASSLDHVPLPFVFVFAGKRGYPRLRRLRLLQVVSALQLSQYRDLILPPSQWDRRLLQ